jgi:TPR repeat protein
MSAGSQAASTLVALQDPILNFAVGYLKANGFSLPECGDVAREWCGKQARRGVADAQVTFGVLLSLGIFGEEDSTAGRFWFESAANQEHPAGLLMLANFLEAGSDGELPDVQRALSLIQRAVEREYPPALVQMAVLCLNGIHVTEDRDLSLKYLRSAARFGDCQGQYLLGVNLLEEARPEAIQEGVYWLEVAAENGSSGAHRHLGYLFKDGLNGLPRDPKRSELHFSVANKIEEAAGRDFSDKGP